MQNLDSFFCEIFFTPKKIKYPPKSTAFSDIARELMVKSLLAKSWLIFPGSISGRAAGFG